MQTQRNQTFNILQNYEKNVQLYFFRTTRHFSSTLLYISSSFFLHVGRHEKLFKSYHVCGWMNKHIVIRA